jgi:hypothetical protein
MRIGERRVVPFRLHNHGRREREVSLAVGPWHVGSGADLVVIGVLEEEQVTLAPCEDRVVRLVIGAVTEPNGGAPDDSHLNAVGEAARFHQDIDACASAYSDVRFEGCARPQRVAVVVAPAECDSVDLDCDCGCCC